VTGFSKREWEAYEQAMREFQAEIDKWPLLHYGGPVSDEQVARDNARERQRLSKAVPEPPEQERRRRRDV
jgi:hypothetical protein